MSDIVDKEFIELIKSSMLELVDNGDWEELIVAQMICYVIY
jgi:hypothetical protein